MEKQISTEIDPSTGIINTYFVTTFGNKNMKIKMADQYSNLHIIYQAFLKYIQIQKNLKYI